jgi:CheY-like chemotaxis protein
MITIPNILIVDDESQNIELAKIILLKEGYHLHFASNGQEALAIIETIKIDVMLLDLFMPIMDGFQTLTELKNPIYNKPLIIVVTAYSDQNSHTQALKNGANDVMIKPYDIIELKTRVKKMLDIALNTKEDKNYDYDAVKTITQKLLEEVHKHHDTISKQELLQLFEKSIF